jgi:hypothetical protein
MNLKEKRRALAESNRHYGPGFSQVHPSEWPVIKDETSTMLAVWRSRCFLVQVKLENGVTRLSINRTELDSTGNWRDGITWDELQEIKNSIGFGNCHAVEIYPAACDLVNVANIRHLWILEQPLPFIWRNATKSHA